MSVEVGSEKGKEEVAKFFHFLDSKKYQCKRTISESMSKDVVSIRYISKEGVKVEVFSGKSLEEEQFEEIYQKLSNE